MVYCIRGRQHTVAYSVRMVATAQSPDVTASQTIDVTAGQSPDVTAGQSPDVTLAKAEMLLPRNSKAERVIY